MVFTRGSFAYVGLVVTAGLLQAAPAPEVSAIRYRFKQGDKLYYALEQKATVAMNFMGQQINQETAQTLDMSWQVTGVDKDGKAKITLTFERVRLKSDGLTGKADFDSKDGKLPDDPSGKQMAEHMKPLVGGEVTFTMDARGRLTDIKPSDKLAKALKNAPAQNLGGLGEFQTEEGMKRSLAQFIVALPTGELTKGKAWTEKITEKSPQGTITLENKYTYEGSTKRGDTKLEKIVNKPVIDVKPDDNTPVPFKLTTKDAKGVVYFDSARGRLVENHLALDMKMEVNMGEIALDCTLKATVTLKLVDKPK
jgi:hypothetical protein